VGLSDYKGHHPIFRQAHIPVPPIPIQRRIASILGAYDDLIEVNRRRIAVLEEMARRLFDEWFVHFRFPGHEGHRMVETEHGVLPEGWEWANLESVCLPRHGIQTGPFGSQLHQSDYVSDGIPLVMPKDLINLKIVTTDIAHIPEALADELGRHRMRIGDVVYGRRGDIGRRAYISSREDGWFCGTGCLRLRPDPDKVSFRYFFDALGLHLTDGAIKGRAQGATMPNLSAKAMIGVPFLLPPMLLQGQYHTFIEESARLVTAVGESNVHLATARDLLLPRLISGELSVTEAERELDAAA
jgi:type I restriction enzyme S subunit